MPKGVRAAGYADTGAAWRAVYEVEEFEARMQSLYFEILPFYEQLHAYVRRRLRAFYKQRFDTSAIPAPLLGNMSAPRLVCISASTAIA